MLYQLTPSFLLCAPMLELAMRRMCRTAVLQLHLLRPASQAGLNVRESTLAKWEAAGGVPPPEQKAA